MERKQIKRAARQKVQHNLVMAVALFLIPVAVQVVVSTVFNFLGGFGSFIATILNFILTAFISIGYAQAFLRIHREQQGQLADLLAGVTIWERSILYEVWYVLFVLAWTIIPTLVFTVAITLGGLTSVATGSSGFLIVAIIIAIISALSLSFIGLFLQIRYGFAAYLLIEEPTLDPKACITRSKQMVHGHYWELIKFFLSFFWWFVLSAFTFGIAGLFVIPYILTAYAAVYDDFRGQNTSPKADVYESVPNPTPLG